MTSPQYEHTAVGELLPGYEASTWYGIGAPKAIPAEIVDKLNKEINAALADHKIKERLADVGSTPVIGSAADFGKFIADETEKWGKVVKFAGVKADWHDVPIQIFLTPDKRMAAMTAIATGGPPSHSLRLLA